MSVHFVTGRPGGGKSLFSMRLIVDELRKGNRCVVTNVAVKLGELNAYAGQDTNRTTDVVGRVRVLNTEETSRFWRYRGPDREVPEMERSSRQRGFCDYRAALDWGGVFYVLDEAHLYFNARAWAEIGPEAQWYMTQHRKLGDDVLLVTQSVESVDVAFRRLGEDFTELVNVAKRRVFGFRGPARFWWSSYVRPPGGTNNRALAHGVFALDREGLARCYDTAAGFGVVGRSADVGARTKGIHWSVLVLVVLCLVGTAFAIPYGGGALVRKFYGPKIFPARQAESVIDQGSPPAAPSVVASTISVAPVAHPTNPTPRYSKRKITAFVTTFDGKPGWVGFADGERVRLSNPRITQYSTDQVTLDGEIIRFYAPEQ